MATKEDVAESERLKVFGASWKRRRARPASYWLRAGLLTFIAVLNLLAALALFACGVFLLATSGGEGNPAKADLQVGTFSVHLGAAHHDAAETAGPERGRAVLAAVCLVLSFVPFSLAALARIQCLMAKDMTLLQPPPEGSEQQD
ncbi:MAG: hypothetical protein ABSE73_19990 [Planctomycetota bacterium]